MNYFDQNPEEEALWLTFDKLCNNCKSRLLSGPPSLEDLETNGFRKIKFIPCRKCDLSEISIFNKKISIANLRALRFEAQKAEGII